MSTLPAYLIYATATLTGFPAEQWSTIEYPSLEICEAQAKWFNAFERQPNRVADRAAKQITIRVAPHCRMRKPVILFDHGEPS